MGLTSFKGDRPHLRDTEIAKNYLDENELRAMGQIVEGYLAFAERQADREVYMTMHDWSEHLDEILVSTGENLLEGAGSISHTQAIEKAHDEYRPTGDNPHIDAYWKNSKGDYIGGKYAANDPKYSIRINID